MLSSTTEHRRRGKSTQTPVSTHDRHQHLMNFGTTSSGPPALDVQTH